MDALRSVGALELGAEAVPAVGLFSLFAQCLLWKEQKVLKLLARSKGLPEHGKLPMCFLQYLWSMLKSSSRNRKLINIPLCINISYYSPRLFFSDPYSKSKLEEKSNKHKDKIKILHLHLRICRVSNKFWNKFHSINTAFLGTLSRSKLDLNIQSYFANRDHFDSLFAFSKSNLYTVHILI